MHSGDIMVKFENTKDEWKVLNPPKRKANYTWFAGGVGEPVHTDLILLIFKILMGRGKHGFAVKIFTRGTNMGISDEQEVRKCTIHKPCWKGLLENALYQTIKIDLRKAAA